MAVYTTQFGYLGTYDGTNFTTTSSVFGLVQTATDNEASGAGSTTFEAGDTITMSSNVLGDDSFAYVGQFGDGWLGQGDTTGQLILFSNDGSIGNGDTLPISPDPFPVCFLEGTRIDTPDGERPVETLARGDLVLAADGSALTVRWLGRQSVVSVFANPLWNYPIRIAAGALGDGLPKRDLFLSPNHALFVDGLLVHAAALVNDISIIRVMDPGKRFTYFHVETEPHALILAEGAPAETFVDNVTRARFDNYAEYQAMYGNEAPVTELNFPRAMSRRQVPQETKERLAAIALSLSRQSRAA